MYSKLRATYLTRDSEGVVHIEEHKRVLHWTLVQRGVQRCSCSHLAGFVSEGEGEKLTRVIQAKRSSLKILLERRCRRNFAV
jgi:hypothetical protein